MNINISNVIKLLLEKISLSEATEEVTFEERELANQVEGNFCVTFMINFVFRLII